MNACHNTCQAIAYSAFELVVGCRADVCAEVLWETQMKTLMRKALESLRNRPSMAMSLRQLNGHMPHFKKASLSEAQLTNETSLHFVKAS